MQAKDIHKLIITPTLQIAGLYSESADILIYGTGWVESEYFYKEQIGHPKNGGLGYWQDEPSDYKDIISWLNKPVNRSLLDRILSSCYYTVLPSDPRVLISNIKYACLICRLHYHRAELNHHELPDSKDAKALAIYHKRWYNSSLGAADIDKNTIVFQRIIDNEL
jgi:hypothetical protein